MFVNFRLMPLIRQEIFDCITLSTKNQLHLNMFMNGNTGCGNELIVTWSTLFLLCSRIHLYNCDEST